MDELVDRPYGEQGQASWTTTLLAATIARNASSVSGGCPTYAERTALAPSLRTVGVDTTGTAGEYHFWLLCLRPSAALAAENLFLRKQLALYQERHIKPQRATDTTRLSLVWLARWFDWRKALAVVQPDLYPLASPGFRLFWRWKSQPGRPPILRSCKHSSARWPVTTRPGAKSALPMNCR